MNNVHVLENDLSSIIHHTKHEGLIGIVRVSLFYYCFTVLTLSFFILLDIVYYFMPFLLSVITHALEEMLVSAKRNPLKYLSSKFILYVFKYHNTASELLIITVIKYNSFLYRKRDQAKS